jgi:hypothetical protein
MSTLNRWAGAGLALGLATTLPGCLVIDVFDNHDDDVSNTRFEASESFAYTVPAASRVRLRLEGISGEVIITGDASATEIRITGERIVGSESQSDADRHLDDLNARLSTSGSEVHVWTDQPSDAHGRRYEVDYRITVPAGFRVIASNTNGEIRIADLAGSIEVDNVNGQVTLTDVASDIRVDVVNGRIVADVDVPSGATVDLGTVNGAIQLNLPRGVSAELFAQVVNGTISLVDLSLEDQTVTARTLRGTIGGGDGSIELATVNGSISIRGVD